MTDKTAAELHADWIVSSSISQFLAKLTAETADGKYGILLALLGDEFRKFEKPRGGGQDFCIRYPKCGGSIADMFTLGIACTAA